MDFYDQCLFRHLEKLKEHFIKFGLPSFFIHLSALSKASKRNKTNQSAFGYQKRATVPTNRDLLIYSYFMGHSLFESRFTEETFFTNP